MLFWQYNWFAKKKFVVRKSSGAKSTVMLKIHLRKGNIFYANFFYRKTLRPIFRISTSCFELKRIPSAYRIANNCSPLFILTIDGCKIVSILNRSNGELEITTIVGQVFYSKILDKSSASPRGKDGLILVATGDSLCCQEKRCMRSVYALRWVGKIKDTRERPIVISHQLSWRDESILYSQNAFQTVNLKNTIFQTFSKEDISFEASIVAIVKSL